MNKKFKIFSGSNTEYLAKMVISNDSELILSKSNLIKFSDGEFVPILQESVRDEVVYIIQSLFSPCSNMMELMLMTDAAKRASATEVIAIIPYMGWARQDRKDRGRTPISMKLVANILKTSGIDKIVTFDLHSEQIQGFFDIPVNLLSANYIFIPYLKSLNLDNILIASPDVGGTKRAKKLADKLHSEMVICYKHRSTDGNIQEMKIIGDVKDKNVIIVDDIVDSAETICKAADLIISEGAKSVYAFVTHPVLTDKAYENIANSKITKLIITDSIPLKDFDDMNELEGKGLDKIKILSLDNMISKAIMVMNNKDSLSEYFDIKI
jgi:ribose-phosphate pyrophosphokinase